jgi:hypothetical protein
MTRLNSGATRDAYLPFVGTIYNWLSNPAGSHVSDYNIDLSQCNLDIEQAEANCKAKIDLQAASYHAQYNGLTAAHELIDAATGLLAKVPIAIVIVAVDGALDLGATANGYRKINNAADAAKGKCKCPCKN